VEKCPAGLGELEKCLSGLVKGGKVSGRVCLAGLGEVWLG